MDGVVLMPDTQGEYDAQNADAPHPDQALVVSQANAYLQRGEKDKAAQLLAGIGWRLDETTGQPRQDTFWEKYRTPILIASGIAGGVGAAGWAAGSAGAAGAGAGGAGAAAALGPTTVGSMAATSAASAVPASLASSTAASGGFWGQLLGLAGGKGALISAGADVAKAAIASRAAGQAANTQSAAADKSLAFQQGIYGQQQQNFAPYLQAGQQALGRLGQQATAPPPTFRPGQPQQLGNLGMGAAPQPPPGQNQMVLMEGPDRVRKPVPQQYVQQLIAKNFRVVQ